MVIISTTFGIEFHMSANGGLIGTSIWLRNRYIVIYALAVMPQLIFRNGCIIGFEGGYDAYAMIILVVSETGEPTMSLLVS